MKFKNVVALVLSCVLIFTSVSAASAAPSKEKHIRIVQQVRIVKQLDPSSTLTASAATADLGTGYLQCFSGGSLTMVCNWNFSLFNSSDKFVFISVGTTFNGPTVGSNLVSQIYSINPPTNSISNQVEKAFVTRGTWSATIDGTGTAMYGGVLSIIGIGSAQVYIS